MVQQLKADQESFQSRFIEMVEKLIGKQATAYGQSENIWKFLADGNYEVDEETQAQAKEAISEDGEYGVKKASERMFQFALALTGGDETNAVVDNSHAVLCCDRSIFGACAAAC